MLSTIKLNILILASSLFVLTNSFAQILHKGSFRMDAQPVSGLASNSVTDIIVVDSTVWFGTGAGLSRTSDSGRSFESFSKEKGLGRGGVSGLAISDEIIWVATGFDTTNEFGNFQAGGGLAYSLDGGTTWVHIPQPGPTPVQNITFDIALRNDEVWITSFGGGLKMSNDQGESWETVTPDSFIFDPLGNLNHRTFSVISVDGALWVGTAGGINRSVDGGLTWTNFNHQNQTNPISGNFVVAIAHQRYANRDIIWAAARETTVESGDTTEFRGVSWSEDQGFSWHTTLRGETVHNFAIHDSVIYAASDNGLFKSIDGGTTWALFPNIENSTGTRIILSNKVYTAGVSAGHALWVGTKNGLAKTYDRGLTWEVFQVFEPTPIHREYHSKLGNIQKTIRTYAYPNPFSPNVHNNLDGVGHVRFQYNTNNATRATLKIYDFAMHLVATVAEKVSRPSNGHFYETWDGADDRGMRVDNGVYFYRLDLEDDGIFWGKLIVLN